MKKILFALLLAPIAAHAQQGTFTTKSMTPETALSAARAALAKETQTGMPMSGLRSQPRVLAIAGIKAIAEAIEF